MGLSESNDGDVSRLRMVELSEGHSDRRVSFVALELLILVSRPHWHGKLHPSSNLASPPIDIIQLLQLPQ